MTVKLSRLREKFDTGARDVFENLCTQLFCVRLELSHAPSRRVNQVGMESNPVDVDSAVVKGDTREEWASTRTWPTTCKCGYQVKYWDEGKKIADGKRGLLKAIDTARKEHVTDLWLFVNTDRTQTTKGEIPKDEEELWARARGQQGEHVVHLHWWDRSKIQSTLEKPGRYGYIRNLYPVSDSNLSDFYEYACGQYLDDKGSELYGQIPLRECYIEPMVVDDSGAIHGAAEYIETRVRSRGDGGSITMICGEPGHGKTSLCMKAVHDFHSHEVRWLNDVVSNVLWFSLNPANTDALTNSRSFDFYSMLSWGNNRRSEKHRIDEDECKSALVFLDAFDELLEWHPGFDLGQFIRDYVTPFQRDTKAHVVITARNMAVQGDLASVELDNESSLLSVVMMQPMSRVEQISWIERCAKHYERIASLGNEGTSEEKDVPQSPLIAEDAHSKAEELRDYRKQYESLNEDGTLGETLGVPAILRMVVSARYLPKDEESVVQIFDGLFHSTWIRHRHDQDKSENETKSELMRHALRVFVGNGLGAPVADELYSPWTFSFYTSHVKEGEQPNSSYIGFLDRSFYQYFLAHEIYSWFRGYVCDEQFKSELSHLARGRLDRTTLTYIRDIHSTGCKASDLAFNSAYKILKETDGILPLPPNTDVAKGIETVIPLERANNVLWNVVSICSVSGHGVTADRLNVQALQLLDMSECVLVHAMLSGAELSSANFKNAILLGAHLEGAHLEGAHLGWAHLRGAVLEGARLIGAHLSGADLRWAHLSGTDLRGAYLRFAHLGRADLRWADLRWADLRWADLRGAHLDERGLELARRSGAILD